MKPIATVLNLMLWVLQVYTGREPHGVSRK
jgi:hypothetical protein